MRIKRIKNWDIPYIAKLIPTVQRRESQRIGFGEPLLQQALKAVGIETVAQYPLLNRYLDLAIPEYKIDIEVDGMAYHLDRNGCRKSDDIHRDIQIASAGWRVIRLWHYEIINDMPACVSK